MIHLGDNRAANENDIVAVLPQVDARGKKVARIFFADGAQTTTTVLALTICKRLEELSCPFKNTAENS